VRREDDVVEAEQLARHVRLALEHVEAGAGDRSVAKRAHQRLLVDDRAARDVDEVALLAERRQHLGIDELSRRGATGGDDDQEVDLARERLGTGEVGVGRFGSRVARGVGDRHAECLGALRDRHADAAEADDAHARAAHLARQRHRSRSPRRRCARSGRLR
jgi:hypothetical protein